MAKSSDKIVGFYQPHAPVRYDGTLVDHYTGEVYTPPAMTKQEFKKECDINNIVAQFSVTGIWSHVNAKAQQGQYMDLPGELDFQESLNQVKRATEAFASLPSKVRDRFKNDPAAFLAFLGDPKNVEEMYELGLAQRPRTVGEADPSPSTPPASTPAPGGSEQ